MSVDSAKIAELLATQARIETRMDHIHKCIHRIEESAKEAARDAAEAARVASATHVTNIEATAMKSRLTRLEAIVYGFVALILIAVVTVWIRSAVPGPALPPGMTP